MKIISIRIFILILLLIVISPRVFADATKTVGNTGADYTTLKNAFDAINAGTLTGNVTLQLIANTTETTSAILFQSGYNGTSSYTSINIYPTTSGITISGNLATPLLDLDGAANLIIDGRVNKIGSTKDLIFTNTSATAGASTIRFVNDANTNIVEYCNVNGSETSATSGIILFSTAAVTGNDFNTIDNNNITCSTDLNRPINAILSIGTVGFENDNLTISNNNIYNFLSRGTASFGINLAANTTTCSITGNSLYEMASFVPTAGVAYTGIYINNNTTGNGFSITNNYIGGQAATCGGSAWTKTTNNSAFTAINLNVAITTNSTVQGNVIQNLAWSNSGAAAWTGINIAAGAVDIGTITENTIGATTGIGSIIVTGGGPTATNVYGINIASTATVDCENNNIGSITADNASTLASNFYGINKTATTGTTTISNNIIGSTTTSSSIIANSASTGNAQSVYGILTAGTGTVTMNGNTIVNLVNNTTNGTGSTAGVINGICSSNGTNTISNNTIHDLSIGNANNSITNTASVTGIALTSATLRTVSGNNIYNLSNSYSSFAGSVIGLYFSGSTGANVVSGNFVYGLSVDAGSTLASIYGIKIASGATTYYNNIINLGGNTATTIYGIYETGGAANNNNLYFNTIHIGGSLGLGITNTSYALYSAVSTNTRNFRNNILSNARSTVGGTNLHYAAFFNYSVATNLTLDYNDYFAPGTGGVLGYYAAANVNTLPLISGKDLLSVSVDPGFANAGGTTPTDYAPSANIIRGNSVAGITTDYAGTTRAATPTMGVFEGTLYYNVQVWVSGTLQAEYTSIKSAFDAINNGTHTGDIEIKLKQSTIETASAVLYQSGYGGTSSYTSVNIYPTVSGLSISGNLATPLIDFSGADNVTIDGRVNATGSTKDLSIINTSNAGATTTTSTIRFINDAINNTVEYCTIKGSETAVGSGIIFFSTAAVTGNDNNTIDNNNITNALDTNRPLNAIYSVGTTGFENDNLTISNNTIYDFLSRSTASYGINLAANTTTCSISGNSLYETTSFAPTASVAYMGIYINNATTGNGFSITNNNIGGQATSCGGSAWTKTTNNNTFNNTFTAINLNVASTVAGSVQGNTIQNFAWSNSAAGSWTGINVVAGNINIGTTVGNTIGASTGTGSIAVTGGATATNIYGINIASTGTVDCENNTIASITASNSDGTLATNFWGINKTATAGTTTISNNTIGSSTANSINANSGSTSNAQTVYGIYSAGTGTVILNTNTVVNLTNGTTNATTATLGLINGITAISGTTTINTNSIHDLTIANANNTAINTASIGGIVLTGATLKTVSGNTIYNLSNTNSSFAGSLIGLYFTGSTGANVVSGNFIYNISADVSSTTASVYGIKIAAGATTYSNNIINLEGNTATTIYGIYETGTGGNNNNLYFNTVYIGGSLTSGITNPSYALYSNVSTNTRNFSNNIFNNVRSTTGGSNLHYAAFFNYAVSTNLTLDYNDYYVSGTGGMLGYYNAANVNALPLIATKDLLSVSVDPLFTNAGSTIATDYQTSGTTLRGTTIAGITADYAGTTRATTPTMGAFEGNLSYNVQVWKTGVLQAEYTTLKAAFAAINNGTHTGSLDVKIKESTIETASAILYQSGYNGTSSYTSVNIYPINTGLSVTGNLATPLIDLNGADNITIDGRVNATGSTKSLTISNTSASATAGTSTVRFINDATNNSVKYCTLKGSETVAASGILFFSTATTTGNDYNTIDNNNITNSTDVSRPVNAVYSAGSVGFENDNLIISNNNIYDFLHRLVASNGVYLAANTTTCSITGNNFYETTSFVPTGSVANNIIYANNTGNNFTITGNNIGGQAVSCGGSAWTKSNAFNNTFAAINLNVGATTASNIQGNTIKNIAWSNSGAAAWTGINIVAGAANIGTSAGNTIGATTGIGSITVTGGATATNVYGINLAGTGTIDCENNIIGSVTADNVSTFASNFYGVNKTATAGTITISNNSIGSTSTANSINANSASTANVQNVYGILSAGTGTVIMNTNTIANLTNSTTNATTTTIGLIDGICSTNGTNTISNNTIRDLSIANTNTSATNTASVCGIALLTNTLRTVSGNTIYNLSNTNTAFTGNVIGLYFSGSGGANVVSGNFIHSLSVNSATTTATLYGIKIASGVCTYSNNIINLGGNTATTIYGIFETGAGGNNNSLYFNTVYVGGTLTSGITNKSYALFSNVSTNVRNFRNNIFNNSRSTTSGSSLHYAAYLNYAVATNLTLDYNDYYASGTGGMLASYNATDISTLAALQTTVGQNLGSISVNPNFASAGGTSSSNYVPAYNRLVGITGTGITTDYTSVTRSSAPTMGAFEISLALSVEVWKSGALQAQYPTLKTAFDKINDGTHTGALEFRLTNFTAETASAILYQSGYNGTSSYTSVNIYPTMSGLSVSGNLAAPLIDLNGADNVTIDGRVNATGSTKSLIITNNSNSAVAGTSTIRLINDATNNTIKYCTLKGSETVATSGVVLFSTAAVTGNDNNTIDNNSITSAISAARPINAIYSAGTATFENSNITISNNLIFDFLSRSTASYGINLAANTTTCSITSNSLYETTSFVPTASVGYIGIYINNTSGNGHTISGNYIGGQSASCGGSAWTKTNAFNNTFTAINLNVGTTTTSNVQGNTIKNFAWSNSLNGAWTGITITAGNANIGTNSANTIGATTGAGSIAVTSGTTGNVVTGILLAGSGLMDCENNVVGSISTLNVSTDASIIYGINRTGSGVSIISNNIIGSTSTANSINATSASTTNAQSVIGINNTNTTNLTVNANTVANLINGSTNTDITSLGVINGITTSNGATTITNNTVYNLTIANANSTSTNTASVCGIACTGNYAKTVSGNTIYNLSNTNTAFTGSVMGINYSGNTVVNTVSGNFIYGLSVSGSSVSGSIYGIKATAGVTTYYNNIINLGGNTATTIYGIYDTGTATQTCNLYFNTVYIGGSLGSGVTNPSYALYSNSAANTRNFRNNLFVNTRSTSGGTNLHYAAYFNYAVSTLLTMDYNDYQTTGTGGILGYYNAANATSLPLITGFDTYSKNVDPVFTVAGGTVAANYSVSSSVIAGITVAGITTDYAGITRKGTPTMGAFEGSLSLNIDVYKAGVFQSTYFTLKDVFDKINNGTHTGALELRLKASTTETTSAVLYQSGYVGGSNYTSIVMYPTVSGLSIIGNIANPLMDLNGADNFTIDGRVNATGASKDLIINNTNTATSSTIRFINTAENNTVKYCTIKGSDTNTASGVICFSTATAGNGNSTNTFDNNNFTGNSNRPVKVIYSAGTASFENKANVISNSNFYDFLNPTVSSYGMDIASNSLNWNISGNSFYETSTFIPTGAFTYNVIRINTGNNNQAVGNYIGGSAAVCGGSPWTINASTPHYFAMIYIAGGASTACVAQNNVISNIDDTSTQGNPWDAIYINAGNVNVTGNTIGATTGTGSIKITTPVPVATAVVSGGVITNVNVIGGGSGYTTAPTVGFSGTGGSGAIATANLTGGVITSVSVSTGGTGYPTTTSVVFDGQTTYSTSHCIRNFSTGTVNITGNNVGSITSVGSTSYSHGIESIILNGGVGTINVSNNVVGSLTTPNSIYTSTTAASSLTKQDLFGIYSMSTGTVTISGNTVANLTSGFTGTLSSATKGINTTAGSNTITNNTVRNISGISAAATVYGISQTSGTTGNTTITGNTVSNLSNTNTTDKVDMYGIYNSCTAGGTNTLSNNFVCGLTHASSNVTSNIYGIYANAGASTLANNIVSLGTGVTTGYSIYGIYDASGTSTNLYFNTVYIGGTAAGTTSYTYAMISSSNASTRNYRNNVFDNARTGGTTGKHYAIRLAGTTGQTINYNDYFVSSGGVLGFLASDRTTLAAWQTATVQDANSLNLNPYFTSVGSTLATDYKIGADLPGVAGTGITTDFNSTSRNTPPSMGAWEVVVNKWKGTTSTDWNTATNWTKNTIPTDGTNLYFDPAPLNNCLLNANHTVNHIINTQSTYRTVTNGYKLSITGDFVFSNGAQIDASATGSTVEFAGSLAQNIPSGTFYNNNVYNMTVNNATGVTVNTDFTVNNLLTINSGKFLTIPSAMQMNVVGTITNNAGVSGLIIKASSTGANGSLIFHNSVGSPVSATVEMYSKAYWDLNAVAGSKYKWQFFGIPVRSIIASPTFDGSYVRKLYESATTTANHWIQQGNDSTLTSFTGLEVCQSAAKTFVFQGQLENGDFNSGQLAYTSGALFSGQHIFANPYTAAIDIRQLSFGTDTEASVYMYNSGSLTDWSSGGQFTPGTNPGQYTAVSKNFAGTLGLPVQIPSMQAILVKAMSLSSLATFGISYSSVVMKNADQQRAPSVNEGSASDKVCTIIEVVGSHYSDKMWIFTEPTCTNHFDNGWDATKYLGSALSPQLYAAGTDGMYQIDAVNTMNNTDLAFQPGEDSQYTLTFTHVNTKRFYDRIYLFDLVENKTIDITESGSSYIFLAESTAKPFNRFKIVTRNYEKNAPDANTEIKIFNSGKTVFVENQSKLSGECIIYDLLGHLLTKAVFSPQEVTNIPFDLHSGAYIITAKTTNEKVSKRIIMP